MTDADEAAALTLAEVLLEVARTRGDSPNVAMVALLAAAAKIVHVAFNLPHKSGYTLQSTYGKVKITFTVEGIAGAGMSS